MLFAHISDKIVDKPVQLLLWSASHWTMPSLYVARNDGIGIGVSSCLRAGYCAHRHRECCHKHPLQRDEIHIFPRVRSDTNVNSVCVPADITCIARRGRAGWRLGRAQPENVAVDIQCSGRCGCTKDTYVARCSVERHVGGGRSWDKQEPGLGVRKIRQLGITVVVDMKLEFLCGDGIADEDGGSGSR